MAPEDLAPGGDQPETITAPAAAPEPVKVDDAAKGADAPEAAAGEGNKPETAKDPAKDAEEATNAAKALQKRKQTMQERLNEVSFERRKAELRAERAERDLADLRGKMKAPNPDEYTDPAKFNADHLNYTMDQREAKSLERASKEAQEEAGRAAATAWRERKEAYVEENPDVDFDSLIATTRVSDPTSYLIADMDEGPAVFVHLAKNPSELRRIETMPERQRPFALGKIAAQLTAPPPKRITNAAPPVDAATGKAPGGTGGPPDDMSAYVAWRKKGGGSKR